MFSANKEPGSGYCIVQPQGGLDIIEHKKYLQEGLEVVIPEIRTKTAGFGQADRPGQLFGRTAGYTCRTLCYRNGSKTQKAGREHVRA